jgi:hypothetical protein
MNHHTKPHFQSVLDKQNLAHHHLTKSTTTRTSVEMAAFERCLDPCPVSGVELPKVLLVRLKKSDGPFTRWALLGEVAQMPGKVILLDIATGTIELGYTADDLEIVPPTELR